MHLKERSYSGNWFRPRPEVYFESTGQLTIVATPWGPRTAAKKVVQIIVDFLHSVQLDSEATSPFSMLSCLSSKANYLRIAVKLANDHLYNNDNKNEYLSGVELFVMIREPQELIWTQIGYPFALLDRSQKPLISLGPQQDPVTEYSPRSGHLAPLPNKMLGLNTNSDFAVESMHLQAQDRLILVSRSELPKEIHNLSHTSRDLESLSKVLVSNATDLPFWLGTVDFNNA